MIERANGVASSEKASMLALLNTLLRRRALILGVTAACVGAAVIVTLVDGRSFVSSSSIVPQTKRPADELAGLAAQFGVALPFQESGESIDFYADLLRTRAILNATVVTPYQTPAGPRTLVQLYRRRGATPEIRQEKSVRRLEKDSHVETDPRAGVVRLTVEAKTAELARQINERMLQLIASFNLQQRQTRAAAERRFTETRLDNARQELRRTEDRLQAFLDRNRQFSNSAPLSFQHDRLTREVAMQQQVYTTLAQAYEKARIEEVRNTPVITIVERPTLPARPKPNGLAFRTILAAIGGLVLGVSLAFWLEWLALSRRVDAANYQEFSQLMGQLRGDVRAPWRIRRRRRSALQERA